MKSDIQANWSYTSVSWSFLKPVRQNIGPDIAPDKDLKQLGIYPPLFGLIGYFKF